ncbi:GNAT family N-acetyltransferase [uncultured Cohaesibacter sp.]|uniref:GNAT family N-acetyltransferase n=1 Tax=uncultured Cohaesibacter sp. TaxID=1002546 RepID=UPI0029C8995D|nr:GNAT family N-acetyltransferase [uncultured Cohaesibacter sp.]
MTLSFSLAKPSQLPHIRTLFIKSMAYIGDRMGIGQSADAFSNMSDFQKAGNLYVLEADGEVLAAAALHEEKNGLYVDYLAVQREHQHEGLGKRMLTELEMLTESRELQHLRLHTPEAMDELVAYYNRRGFAETHRVMPSHGRDQLMRVHFRKEITLNDQGMDLEYEHDRQLS